MPIYRLENVIQLYDWGSHTAIAELLGQPSPSPEPQAELWLGTHPKGPSLTVDDDRRLPLQQLIDGRPEAILGPDIAGRFANRLPFLFKVLAAAQPLSIQAHPSKPQAVEGFVHENQVGIALDAPQRNYRDDNHKPEIICALEPFWGLNGFRTAAAAADLLAPICPRGLEAACRGLKGEGAPGLRSFFVAMLEYPEQGRPEAVREVMAKAAPMAERSPVYRWVVELGHAYPVDMGVLSPALLNLVRLAPGEAMYLPAGQLHAYLKGVGIELMANSDNVLRGGLTPKHVDVPELLKVVCFEDSPIEILEPIPLGPAEAGYPCPAAEFLLSRIQTSSDRSYRAAARPGVEMLLCTAGEGRIGHEDVTLTIKTGDSFLVPADVGPYTLDGSLTLYKATVPPSDQ